MNLLPPAAQPRLPHFTFSLIPVNQSPQRLAHCCTPHAHSRLVRSFARNCLFSPLRCWKAHEQAVLALLTSHRTHLPLKNSRVRFNCPRRLRNKPCKHFKHVLTRDRSTRPLVSFFRSPRYCEYYSHSQKAKIILVIDLKWQLFPLSALNINLFIINVNIYFPKSL